MNSVKIAQYLLFSVLSGENIARCLAYLRFNETTS
jgi:hypothetical protein